MAEHDNRVVTIALLESEWLTALDALNDRAEQTHELANEVGDADLVTAAEDYDRVGAAIRAEVNAVEVGKRLEKINGYTVIAEKADVDGNRFILGATVRAVGFEYVVARCYPASMHPTSWFNGYYFDSLPAALTMFEEK